jgi:penicillin amidase
MQQITPQDMMALQTDNYNVFGEMANPIFIKNILAETLNGEEARYFELLKNWNLRNDVDSKGATIFVKTWDIFQDTVFSDEYANAPSVIMKPWASTLLEGVLKDSAFKFLDDVRTPTKETLADMTTVAFKKAVAVLLESEKAGKLEWAKYKDTRVNHLLQKIAPFNRSHLPIGGGSNVINATRDNHGPSWRMVVSLTEKTEAYGVYPGGQSGNPGSKFYDNFIDQWVAGKYYPLWMMTADEQKDKRVHWVMHFSKS